MLEVTLRNYAILPRPLGRGRMASFNGDMEFSCQNRKLEALKRRTSYLSHRKAAGGPPRQRAVSMRSIGMSEEVPRPPYLAASLARSA